MPHFALWGWTAHDRGRNRRPHLAVAVPCGPSQAAQRARQSDPYRQHLHNDRLRAREHFGNVYQMALENQHPRILSPVNLNQMGLDEATGKIWKSWQWSYLLEESYCRARPNSYYRFFGFAGRRPLQMLSPDPQPDGLHPIYFFDSILFDFASVVRLGSAAARHRLWQSIQAADLRSFSAIRQLQWHPRATTTDNTDNRIHQRFIKLFLIINEFRGPFVEQVSHQGLS